MLRTFWAGLNVFERVVALVTALAAGATLAGAVHAGITVPQKLDAHMLQSDSLLSNQREQIDIGRASLCIQVYPDAKIACLQRYGLTP